jgi:hypothetical protein
MRQPQTRRKRRKFAIINIGTNKSSCEPNSVKHAIRQTITARAHERRIDKPNIKSRIVRNQNRIADELKQRLQRLVNRRRAGHHRVGDASQHSYKRRNCAQRVYKCREPTNLFTPAIFDRTDFGNRFELARPTGRLKVEHTKLDVTQRDARDIVSTSRSRHNARDINHN